MLRFVGARVFYFPDYWAQGAHALFVQKKEKKEKKERVSACCNGHAVKAVRSAMITEIQTGTPFIRSSTAILGKGLTS
jgi:hypothetical protein